MHLMGCELTTRHISWEYTQEAQLLDVDPFSHSFVISLLTIYLHMY